MEKIRVRGKKYLSVLIISLIFTVTLIAAIKPAKAAYVKFYVNQPSGYIPFQTPGANQAVVVDIYIETSGIPDGWGVQQGITGWGIDLRVDPNVLSINTVAPPPPPMPPPPPDAKVVGAQAGYCMFTYAGYYGLADNLLPGSADPTTGYWDDIVESLMPVTYGGIGDSMTAYYPKLVTILMTSKSDTQPCLIDIIDAEYVLADGSVHKVDIVLDGYYGQPPPRHMSYQGSLLPPGDPTDTEWHEIYPQYCKMWDLVDWTDNTDGDLTVSDQIDMMNETGWTHHFHVDQVTVTIHWTFKPDGETPTGYEAACEPFEPHTVEIGEDTTTGEPEVVNPIGTSWHEIYPEYSREFVITSHEDSDGDGNLDPSEQFDFEYFGEGVIRWAHLDDITTDIILSDKGEPDPPVPEFPLGAAVEVGLIVAVAYIWWTRRRKLTEVP